MWIFSQIADEFDRIRKEDGEFLDSVLQPWVGSTLDDNSPWYRNAAIYTGAGLAYSTFHLSTTVASGFLDVLRIGDGVKKGGWGYAEDALRLLVVAGPASRVARMGLSRVLAVDAIASLGNCSWVAATRALRMTGTRHAALLTDLAEAAGLPSVSAMGGAWLHDVVGTMRALGGRVSFVFGFNSLEGVAKAVRANPNAAVLFSVEWQMGAKKVGHTLIAFRDALGRFRILDRTGQVAKSLAELESLVPGYQGIANAVAYGSGAVLHNAWAVQALETLPLLFQQGKAAWLGTSPLDRIALEVRSVPVRAPEPAVTQPKRQQPQKASQPSQPGVYTEKQELSCYRVNSDGKTACVQQTRRTYRVGTGDTLGKIAGRMYGNAKHWQIIYDANVGVIGPNPHVVKVGTVLQIP